MRKLIYLVTVSMLSSFMTLPSTAMEERNNLGNSQNIERKKVYGEALSSLKEYIEVLNEHPYFFQEVRKGMRGTIGIQAPGLEGEKVSLMPFVPREEIEVIHLITPDWRALISDLFSGERLKVMYGNEVPRAVSNFGATHEKYKNRLGDMNDHGETISIKFYPNADVAMVKREEDKNITEKIYGQLLSILGDKDKFNLEEQDQLKAYRQALLSLALAGNHTAQVYLYEDFVSSRLGYTARSKDLDQGQQILFQALNHLLRYPVT